MRTEGGRGPAPDHDMLASLVGGCGRSFMAVSSRSLTQTPVRNLTSPVPLPTRRSALDSSGPCSFIASTRAYVAALAAAAAASRLGLIEPRPGLDAAWHRARPRRPSSWSADVRRSGSDEGAERHLPCRSVQECSLDKGVDSRHSCGSRPTPQASPLAVPAYRRTNMVTGYPHIGRSTAERHSLASSGCLEDGRWSLWARRSPYTPSTESALRLVTSLFGVLDVNVVAAYITSPSPF